MWRLFVLIWLGHIAAPGWASGQSVETKAVEVLREPVVAGCKYTFQLQKIRIGSRWLTLDLYRSREPGQHPLIVVLTGSQGTLSRRTPVMPRRDNIGEKHLAASCFTVAVPHYFDIIGIQSTFDRVLLRRHFDDICVALRRVLEAEGDLTETRELPIGIFAESYGAYLAVALARVEPRVRVISEFGGGWPDASNEPNLNRLVALVYHGQADSVVPLSEGLRLAVKLNESKAQVYLRVCDDEGHNLSIASREAQLRESISLFTEVLVKSQPRQKYEESVFLNGARCPMVFESSR